MQSRRNKRAAKKFFRKLFKIFNVSQGIITDEMKSYGVTRREILPGGRVSPKSLSQQPL
jgi:putative transposase